MKYLITLILLFATTAGFSQTIADLEKELVQVQNGGYNQYLDKNKKWKTATELDKNYDHAFCTYSKQIIRICNKILLIDKYNENALMTKYFETYGLAFCEGREIEQTDGPAGNSQRYHDSVLLLFDNLIAADSLNPVPYVLKAKIPYIDKKISVQERQALLNKALSLDSLNSEANYQMGCDYYDALTRNGKDSLTADELKSMAIKAFEHFRIVFNADTTHTPELCYVLTQLATFLDVEADAYKPQLINYKDGLYFPLLYLTEMPADWKTNIRVNIIRQFSLDELKNDWYSRQLSAMQEPVLKDVRNTEIYRFTWLRSFSAPVAVRIFEDHNDHYLAWKSCDGYGGNSPGKLVVDRSKKLSKRQWLKFQDMLQKMDFLNMPASIESIGCDGSEWILEGISGNSYHVVNRWSPENDDFSKACKYLLKLTKIKIDKEEMY